MKKIALIFALSFTTTTWAAEIPDADSPAAKLFANKCSVCHAMPYPERLDWPHWRHMLGVMKQRMDERGIAEPSNAEWRQIAAYLKKNAR